MKKIGILAISWLLCSAFTIHTIGDSTMAEKDLAKAGPERGWGMMFQNFLDDGVKVINYAQFGHNDAKEDDPARYAPAYGAYQDNLRFFIRTAKEKGAKPVLLTPVARRQLSDRQAAEYTFEKVMFQEQDGIKWDPFNNR